MNKVDEGETNEKLNYGGSPHWDLKMAAVLNKNVKSFSP